MANKIHKITVTDASTQGKVTVNAAVTNLFIDDDKGNLRLESSDELGGKNIVLKSKKDIKIKPVDDLSLYSEYRTGKEDEFSVKVLDTNDKPVKLQLNTSEILLTTKDKEGADANVMDVTVNSAKDTRGYLKVRAQAIDLRSESHGGIALQPKGRDNEGNMNKIKFEHGGGDGLEFGTFNTEKTSIFTDEYRFNKDGIWKMATREKEESDKKEVADPTTHYKYKKQGDDFYDIIDSDDEQCTTNDIIKTAHVFNGGIDRHAKITGGGNIEISANNYYTVAYEESEPEDIYDEGVEIELKSTENLLAGNYKYDEIKDKFFTANFAKDHIKTLTSNDSIAINLNKVYANGGGNDFVGYCRITKIGAPKIKIESANDVEISSNDDIILSVDGNTCHVSDIIKLVDYCKELEFGPWAPIEPTFED